jgi:pumilio RNA-binding family
MHQFHSGRRAIIVDLALSVTGSQLIASVLPNVRKPLHTLVDLMELQLLQVDKDQRTLLYESIRGHIVTLRGCKTGSKVIWLL